MACHCFILCLCFFYTVIHHCLIQFALWTMTLIFLCPTFTFPNYYGLYFKHLSSSLTMSPLLLPEAILGLQNHRDGFCIAHGIEENQEATFNN